MLRALSISISLIACLAGCQTETQVVGRGPYQLQRTHVDPQPQARRVEPSHTTVTQNDPADPCATRLQDLTGALMSYYIVHGQLPAQLQELRGMADLDVELNFTCPLSGLAYIYNPAGLLAPNGAYRLVLYDAAASHHGMRWGVAFSTGPGGKLRNGFVLNFSDEQLKAYHPLAPETQASN